MQRALKTFAFSSIAALVLVFGIGSADAQTYSGRATAVRGNVAGVPIPTVVGVNDTGDLPSGGGDINLASVAVNVLGITADLDTVRTSGFGNFSESQASLANLDVNLTGVSSALRVRATEVSSSTQCTCPAATCTGSSTVTGLIVGFGGNETTVTVTGAPNQTFFRVQGTVRLDITINEQISGPGSLTVNALHITLTNTVTGVITSDIVVSSSHSDIVCAAPVPNTKFSGRATGVQLRVGPVVTAIVADTGPLPSNGGMISVAVASSSTGSPPFLTTGAVTSNTFGGFPANVATSTSDSTVNNLSATLSGGVTVNATILQSNTICTCSSGTPTCTGDSTVVGGTVTGPGFSITIVADSPPNTVITLPFGLGSIIVNEQIGGGVGQDEITVNALHISLLPRIGVLRTDLIVASSHSDINCLLAAGPTAAGASISGRVLRANGRPLSRVTVRLLDGQGNVRIAMTSSFGYYRFEDVPVGETYVLIPRHKVYRFDPQTISLFDDLAQVDFIPQGSP